MGNKISWPEVLTKKFKLTEKEYEHSILGNIDIYTKQSDPDTQVFCKHINAGIF